MKEGPFQEAMLGVSDYFPCCQLRLFYQEDPGTQACPNQAEGKPPRKALEPQEGALPLRSHLGSAFAMSDQYSIFSGRKGVYQKERFRGAGLGLRP